MDNQLTNDIQSWLNTEHTTTDMIIKGATLLLSLNRNQILYGNILRTPSRPVWREKLEYELKKFLRIRLDGLTRSQVIQLDQRVTKEADSILREGEIIKKPEILTEKATENDGKADDADSQEKVSLKGKRSDHDQLPVSIQNLWVNNAGIWKKIRKLHATLRTMNNAPSCDRYEYLVQMDELDRKYRKNMQEYDEYILKGKSGGALNEHGPIDDKPADSEDVPQSDTTSEAPQTESQTDGEQDAATIIHARRAYLRRNMPKAVALMEKQNANTITVLEEQALEQFLLEIQQNVNIILSLGGKFNTRVTSILNSLNIKLTLE